MEGSGDLNRLLRLCYGWGVHKMRKEDMNTGLICRKFFERWIIGNPGNRWEDIINMNTIKRDIKSRPFME